MEQHWIAGSRGERPNFTNDPGAQRRANIECSTWNTSSVTDTATL